MSFLQIESFSQQTYSSHFSVMSFVSAEYGFQKNISKNTEDRTMFSEGRAMNSAAVKSRFLLLTLKTSITDRRTSRCSTSVARPLVFLIILETGLRSLSLAPHGPAALAQVVAVDELRVHLQVHLQALAVGQARLLGALMRRQLAQQGRLERGGAVGVANGEGGLAKRRTKQARA